MQAYILSCAAILGMILVPLTADAAAVISEVHWAGSSLSSADEWVEVTCVKEAEEAEESKEAKEAEECLLGGWKILTRKSDGSDGVMFTFPSGYQLQPGEVIIISNFSAVESALSQEPDFVTSDVSLPNSNLLLQLIDPHGAVMDTVDDGSGAPFAGANPSGGAKASMERIDLLAPGSIKENWRTAVESRGFDAGAMIFGTAGSVDFGDSDDSSSSSFSSNNGQLTMDNGDGNSSSSAGESSDNGPWTMDNGEADSSSSAHESNSSFSSTSSSLAPQVPQVLIRITEVLSNPIGVDTREWIEVGNLGSDTVDITGWKLKKGSASFIFSNLFLEAGAHRMFTKEQTGISLPNTGGEVQLLNTAGAVVDTFTYVETGEEVSYGIFDSSQRSFCIPTPNTLNTIIDLSSQITIQSGNTEGEEKVSINLEATVEEGSLASAQCEWDFGDGFTSDKCNPASHTFGEPGAYEVVLEVRSICGVANSVTLDVMVHEKEAKEAKESKEAAEAQENKQISSSASSASLASYQRGILLTEVYPSPNKGEQEWLELWNVTDQEIDLAGYFLDDIADGGSKPTELKTVSIKPNTFFVLSAEYFSVSFNNGGDSVRLLAPDHTVVFDIAYPSVKTGMSYIRDGDVWCMGAPTPARAGTCGQMVAPPVATSSAAKKIVSSAAKAVSAKASAAKATTSSSNIFTTKYRNVIPETAVQSGTALASAELMSLLDQQFQNPVSVAPAESRSVAGMAVGSVGVLGAGFWVLRKLYGI